MTRFHSSAKLTDDAVSSLPLDAARAELLEEIMDTVAPDRTTTPLAPAHSRRGWLVPVAATAVVAAVAGSTFWWQASQPGPAGVSGVAAQPSASPSAATPVSDPSDYRAVLTAPGWTVTSTEDDGSYGEVDYASGDASFEITWYAADSYAGYVEDREHIVTPPAPGEPVQVLGLAGQLWAYSADDHTTIREVQAGHWMELRGTGVTRIDYLDLLSQLRLVDLGQFEAALPARFVATGKRSSAITSILDGIAAVAAPARSAFPMGTNPQLHSDEQDPYQLGAYVAGQVTCAWLGQYVQARADGDQSSATDAVEFLATSRQWPVLQQMNSQGDYPEVVWQYADEIAAGQQPDGYRQALGC